MMSAYSLMGTYKVYVFEPDQPIRGASEGNAGTICPNLKPWSTKSPIGVFKQNLLLKEADRACIFRFGLLFNKEIINWGKHFLLNRTEKKIEA